MTNHRDEHAREHMNEFEFEMPAGFEDGPAAGMSNVVYWWLSMALLVTPEQVQESSLWQMHLSHLRNYTADGFDEDRWDIIEDWLGRAFKDISAGLPDALVKPVRTAARVRTLDAIEAAGQAVLHSDEFAAEAATGNEQGPFTSLHWALDAWALFTSQYVRPAGDRHPEVLRSAANVTAELTPLRRTANITYNVNSLVDALGNPRSNPKRADGRRSARTSMNPLTEHLY
ncbi:hypothetical protein ACWGJ9_08230 [Curtobacterium citreum]